jgi:serine/threonine-protein kinase
MRRAATLALVILAACTLRGATLPPAAAPADRFRASGSLIYVSEPTENAVKVYRALGHDQAPVATITKGISGPAGLAVDGAGNLYVANTTNDTVTEYAESGSAPVATYSTQLVAPVGVAIDGAGTLYVANFGSFKFSIVEFASGGSSPSRIIATPCSCYPIGLTLDAQGNLYVAYDTFYEQSVVYEYAPGSSSGTALDLQLGKTRWEAAGLLFDAAGNLLVANASLPGVQIFAPGAKTPKATFGKTGSPRLLAFGRNEGQLFVTNTDRSVVEEYRYPHIKLVNAIASGLKSVYGVAVSP